MKTQGHTDSLGTRPSEGGDKETSDAPAGQGAPRTTASVGARKEAQHRLSSESLEGVWLCQHLSFRPVASKIVSEYVSVILSHPYFSNLLQQPLEKNTVLSRAFH